MIKRFLVLIACLMMLAPGSGQALDALDMIHVENAQVNLQLLMPASWLLIPAVEESSLHTYILFDESDLEMQRYVTLSLVPKTGELPEEIAVFRDEADALFAQANGADPTDDMLSTLQEQAVIDRMDAVVAVSKDEPFCLLFIDDDTRYIFVMYPDPDTVDDALYREQVGAICESIALLRNPHPPRYDEAAFDVSPLSDGLSIAKYTGDALRVSIPSTIGGKTVVAIGEGAFAKTPVQHVSIPNTVREIGIGAFSGCNYLRTVSMPDSLQWIGDTAFESCFQLQRVALPEGLTEIGGGAFWGCLRLQTVSLPSSLGHIGEHAFVMTNSLTAFEMPEAGMAYAVQDGALYTKDLGKLLMYPARRDDVYYAIPEGVEQVDPYAFFAAGLTDIVFPSTLTSIEALTCIGTNMLERVVIPAQVTSIDPEAFPSLPALIIYGSEGSAAEAFAQDKGLSFEAIDTYTRP